MKKIFFIVLFSQILYSQNFEFNEIKLNYPCVSNYMYNEISDIDYSSQHPIRNILKENLISVEESNIIKYNVEVRYKIYRKIINFCMEEYSIKIDTEDKKMNSDKKKTMMKIRFERLTDMLLSGEFAFYTGYFYGLKNHNNEKIVQNSRKE